MVVRDGGICICVFPYLWNPYLFYLSLSLTFLFLSSCRLYVCFVEQLTDTQDVRDDDLHFASRREGQIILSVCPETSDAHLSGGRVEEPV